MSEHNVVVLRGTLAGEATRRELASGEVVVNFDVTTRDETGSRTVPVAWSAPPAGDVPVAAGEELVVVGSVRRRFFRAGGATQSRTEVVADGLAALSRRRDVERLLAAPRAALAAAPAVSRTRGRG